MTKSVSQHQNRDYSKQFAWTYELNKDLYKCYVKAKEDPDKKTRYMSRLKKYWDKIQTKLNNFSLKNF